MTTVRLSRVRLPGVEGIFDVQLGDGVVVRISPAGTGRETSGETLDCSGRWLTPGLWDHHVHFSQWTVQRKRLDLSTTTSAAEVLALLRGAEQPGEFLVGFGYRDGLWPDEPSTAALDEATGCRPTVLICMDLHSAWLNTAAQRELEIAAGSDGIVREGPWFAALERLQQRSQPTHADYRDAAAAAAARGVTGIVDFENDDNLTRWPQRTAAGITHFRVHASVWPDRLAEAMNRGVRTGDVLDETGLVTFGPLKVISDGSLNTRTAWCWEPYAGLDPSHPHACGGPTVPPDQVRELMRTARDSGVSAAIHAIGDRANTVVLDAFEELGMDGRIEHAQLLRHDDVARFAALGLAASVQPEHAMDDRDVAEAHWPGRTDRAFMLASLHDAGVVLHLGSDAPVSALDPWVQIAAAVTRSRDGREPWHPEQRIDASIALAASARGRVQVREGDPADLAVVDHNPLTADGETLRRMPVAATLVAGRFTHRAL